VCVCVNAYGCVCVCVCVCVCDGPLSLAAPVHAGEKHAWSNPKRVPRGQQKWPQMGCPEAGVAKRGSVGQADRVAPAENIHQCVCDPHDKRGGGGEGAVMGSLSIHDQFTSSFCSLSLLGCCLWLGPRICHTHAPQCMKRAQFIQLQVL